MLVLFLLLPVGCPTPESITIMPLEDQRVHVNETLLLALRLDRSVADASWSLSAPSVPEISRNAQLYPAGSTATFRWAPLASQAGTHQFTFSVAAEGATDAETITIEVVGDDGAPRFIQPSSGGAYDLSRTPEIVVPIQVLDEDSISVEIREREPRIDGAELTRLTGTSAQWRWRPSPSQVDTSLRYDLRLEADDGTNPPVEHTYEIVLFAEGRGGCDGEPPRIGETSPPPPELVATARDYEVLATITDETGFRDAPLLYFTQHAPASPSDPDLTSPSMRSVPFVGLGDSQYVAYIPNLQLSPGEQRTLYSFVVVTDNDDPTGTACDHTTVGPMVEFRVAAPETADPVGYCEVCSVDGQCAGGLCVPGDPYARCGVDCDGGCPSGAECREVTSREGNVSEQCVPADGSCLGSGECANDAYEPNDAESEAELIAVDDLLEGVICPGDEDYFELQMVNGQRYEVTAAGWDASRADIDMELLAPTGRSIAGSWSASDTETISACTPETGTHYIWLYGYEETHQSTYLLDVRESSEACCEDDDHEDNDVQPEGTSLRCGREVDATLCQGDDDWFCIEVSEPSTARLSMDCDAATGDLDLSLLDSDGVVLDDDLASTCDSELEVYLPAAGEYCALVHGWGDAEGAYVLGCSITAGGSCSDTQVCPSGTVCAGDEGCVDDRCNGASDCPAGHFCPDPGGTSTARDCVRSCTSDLDCRAGYACKTFEAGRGCALTGLGQTGQPCDSFRDCAGERICLPAGSTGYCAEIGCSSSADCPTDDHTGMPRPSHCVDVGGAERLCLMDCLFGDAQCDINRGTCLRTFNEEIDVVWVCALDEHSPPE